MTSENEVPMKNHHKFLCNTHGLVVNQFIWSLILILGYLDYENLWLNYLVECGSTNRIQFFSKPVGDPEAVFPQLDLK